MGHLDQVGRSLVAALAAPSEETDYVVQQALLAAIVESSDDAIVSKTLEGRILTWNTGAVRIFGYRPEEAIGQPITMIIPPELHDQEREILDKVRRGERVDHFDTVRVTKDGRRIPISLTVSPIRNRHGVIIGASKVARDISERKRIEQTTVETEQALLEADRRKDDFLAQLSHELRNLLAPVRYALAANRKREQTIEQRWRSDEIIERQLTRMSRLLDDLLDLARVKRGVLELKKTPTDLSTALHESIEIARPLINAKDHTLTVELPAQPICIEADPERLAQVFSNLLINAAKYTDPGGRITLRALRTAGEALVSVRDNGIGVAPEMLPQLFGMFTQAPAALPRAEGGLGVGLALVRGLVQLHGGTVEAHSEGPGKGSEFVIRLPVGEPQRLPAHETAPNRPGTDAQLRVLVVDDNRDAADTCAMLLEISGHEVQKAYSGTEALTTASGFRPQALLLDIDLPDLDGYTLAQQIRATDWGREAFLIAVSGWGQEEDRRRALTVGFDHHLTKPIAAGAVEALLQSASTGAQRRGRGEARAAANLS